MEVSGYMWRVMKVWEYMCGQEWWMCDGVDGYVYGFRRQKGRKKVHARCVWVYTVPPDVKEVIGWAVLGHLIFNVQRSIINSYVQNTLKVQKWSLQCQSPFLPPSITYGILNVGFVGALTERGLHSGLRDDNSQEDYEDVHTHQDAHETNQHPVLHPLQEGYGERRWMREGGIFHISIILSSKLDFQSYHLCVGFWITENLVDTEHLP